MAKWSHFFLFTAIWSLIEQCFTKALINTKSLFLIIHLAEKMNINKTEFLTDFEENTAAYIYYHNRLATRGVSYRRNTWERCNLREFQWKKIINFYFSSHSGLHFKYIFPVSI